MNILSDPGSGPELDALALDDAARLPFSGTFRYDRSLSGGLLDYASLVLRPDGTYQGKVEATLLNPSVRSFGPPCFLPEEGTWNVYLVTGKPKLKVRPTTSRARVYAATLEDGQLVLSRRGRTTALVADYPLSATLCCAHGSEIELEAARAG